MTRRPWDGWPFRPLRALRSLQWQLALSYAAMAAVLCTSLGFVIMQVLGSVLLEQDTQNIRARAAIVGDLVYQNLNRGLTSVLAEASQYAQARVCAFDTSGVQQGCGSAGQTPPVSRQAQPTLDTEVAPVQVPIAPYSAIAGGQQSSVFGYLTLDDPLTYRDATQRSAQAAIFRLTLLATAISAGAGLVLGRGLTAPLRALNDAARRLGGGNLNARAPEEGDDEIGELGAGFNRMASRMQESFSTLESERDALRTFIADMSHELRTPITALHTFVDLLAHGAAEDESVRDEFLQESATQIDRLEWLVQNLLDLSKFDAGLAEVHVEKVDVRPLVERSVGEARLAAERKGVIVEFAPTQGPILAAADTNRLRQALSNVLLNAVKFTPSGGKIEVSLESARKVATILVRDTGPGIPPDELPHVFERFYRGPSTANLAGGSGLGLPIVQSIMQAHAGDVEVHSEFGQGTEVVLTLPAL
ncbi:MAG TPA: HAMP domain-containing sensor histidine kinase [Chloroflexota bacterium]|nr:HAMP domain-containing sensor histidine kinase [Chloroflexota bacterium]